MPTHGVFLMARRSTAHMNNLKIWPPPSSVNILKLKSRINSRTMRPTPSLNAKTAFWTLPNSLDISIHQTEQTSFSNNSVSTQDSKCLHRCFAQLWSFWTQPNKVKPSNDTERSVHKEFQWENLIFFNPFHFNDNFRRIFNPFLSKIDELFP